jgi:hypothetical protein
MNRWMTALILLAVGTSSLRAQHEIPYIPLSKLPTMDGDLSDWESTLGSPQFSSSDFLSITCPRHYVFLEEEEMIDFWVPWASHGPDGQRLKCSVAAENQQIEVWLGWNDHENQILLAARVQDDAFGTNSSPENPKLAWKSDDFEVFIDSDNSGGAYDSTYAHAQQYVLSPARQEAILLTLAVANPEMFSHPPHTTVAVRRDCTLYTYEMAIPGWDSLDSLGVGVRHDFQRGEVIGLTVGLGDFDSREDADALANLYSAYSILDGLPDAYKDADSFLDFRLAGPSPDFSGDGKVDFADFFLFADAFGTVAEGETGKFDLDLNGAIDFSDFFLFADAWK